MLWDFRCIVFARKWKNSSKNNASIYFCENEWTAGRRNLGTWGQLPPQILAELEAKPVPPKNLYH